MPGGGLEAVRHIAAVWPVIRVIMLTVSEQEDDVTTALRAGARAYVLKGVSSRDLIQVVFHRFVSNSIQHLVHEMGERLLERFPQLAEVSFAAQNRLWDTATVSESNPKVKVYTDPRPPYGLITLTMRRDDEG